MEETNYFLKTEDDKEGPYPKEYLQFLLSQGKINLESHVKAEGDIAWSNVKTVLNLVPVLSTEENEKRNSKYALIITLFVIALSVAYSLFERYLIYKHHTNVSKLVLTKIGFL